MSPKAFCMKLAKAYCNYKQCQVSTMGLQNLCLILLRTQYGPEHQITAINIKTCRHQTRQPKQQTIANFLFTHMEKIEMITK